MLRRRPARRAAVVGGVAAVAHHAGAKSAQADAAGQVPPGEPQGQAPAPPVAAPAPEVGGTDMVAQLQALKKLLDDGVLTQAEFDTEKQKILAAS